MTVTATEVRPGRPGDDPRRDAFVLAHPRASFFHLSSWRTCVERVFRHEPRDLLAFRGEQLVGVLPLMNSPGLMGGQNLVSMPFGVYGGPIGVDREAEQALVESAVQLSERMLMGRLELRYLDDPGPELVGSDLYWTFIKELPESPGEVLAQMPKKARAEARKARTRHGLELSTGNWYVEDLYRLFLRNKHLLGSPAMPVEFFRELVEVHGDDVRVHLVRRGRHPLAAVMSFSFRDTLIAYYSGTEAGADRSFSASNFMYMALQEWAVEHDYRVFDFGRSRKEAGSFKFKVHQGFEPQALHYRYHLVRDRGLPSFNPSNPRTAVLRETWSRLPVWLVRRLSNGLARYLP